jgi:hypothetical protein
MWQPTSEPAEKNVVAVSQPDGSTAVACEDAPKTAVHLVVTPSLVVPTEPLRTVPLDQLIEQRILCSHRDEMMSAQMSGMHRRRDTEASRPAPPSLVDAGGVMPHDPSEAVIQGCHPHGFIAAAVSAFANHYPLALRPQHFWLMILQAIATHVELHAEEVRSKWVAHQGKKELLVRRDEFVLGKPNDWAGVIGAPDGFFAQIGQNVVAGVMQELQPAFGGTTADERIAGAITVMDATKSFFSFKCMTCCGFPRVTLEGSLDDWRALRAHAEALVMTRCSAKFAAGWCAALLPLLDKFVAEYEAGLAGSTGADEPFWNSMVKRGGTSGSGSRTWFSGWVNILFPYIEEQPNHWCVPYSSSNGYVQEGRDGGSYGMSAPRGCDGPDCADFPKGLAEAPVTWEYHGSELPLKFRAGFVGATQDPETKTVSPRVGWFIVRQE